MFPAPAKPSFFTVTGSAAAVGGMVIPPTDVGGYGSISVQISGTFVGTVTFEVSNDWVNWVSAVMGPVGSVATMTATATAGGIFEVPCTFRYFRVRCTAYTSGTIVGVAVVSAVPTATDNISGAIAQSGTWTMQPGNTANTTPWLFTPRPAATGSTLTKHRLIAAATTNATSVKATAGQLYVVHAYNVSAAVKYLKLYNKASAPTVGTDTPVETHAIAAGAALRLDFTEHGNPFATGIAYALTGGGADADTTALAAGDVVLNMLYN